MLFRSKGIEAALRDGAGLVLLCNPHNPLGRVFDRSELEGIAKLVERFEARVFADEIHAPIRYGGRPHIPFASLSDQAAQISVTATSTSKAFNTPGLKCGQIILTAEQDRERWREMGWFGEHGAGTVGVLAAAAAYRDGDKWLARFIATLEENRALLEQLISELLPEAQFSAPEGTYLAWVDMSAYGEELEWGKTLRNEAGLAIVDGRDCGRAGSDHIRINFATSQHVIRSAIGRLGSFVSA